MVETIATLFVISLHQQKIELRPCVRNQITTDFTQRKFQGSKSTDLNRAIDWAPSGGHVNHLWHKSGLVWTSCFHIECLLAKPTSNVKRRSKRARICAKGDRQVCLTEPDRLRAPDPSISNVEISRGILNLGGGWAFLGVPGSTGRIQNFLLM